MIDVHFICRDCGTPCDPQAARERGGLCARCAFPTRVTVRTFQLAIDRSAAVSDVLGAMSSALDLIDRDPFRDAIDRAAARWAADNPEDP